MSKQNISATAVIIWLFFVCGAAGFGIYLLYLIVSALQKYIGA